MQHATKTWLLTIVAGDIDQPHDCRKNSPVEYEEPGTILRNYSDLNTSHWDRWPATANPKNYGMAIFVSTPFLYSSYVGEGLKMRITLLG